jgi:hypothetical protein
VKSKESNSSTCEEGHHAQKLSSAQKKRMHLEVGDIKKYYGRLERLLLSRFEMSRSTMVG